MVPCLCIDDSGRPDCIPNSCWPKKGERYHITLIYFTEIDRQHSCDLAEMSTPKEAYPYCGYRLDRFTVAPEDLDAFMELVHLSTELNDVDIDVEKLTEELVS